MCYVLAGLLHVGNINFEGEDNASITAPASLARKGDSSARPGLSVCLAHDDDSGRNYHGADSKPPRAPAHLRPRALLVNSYRRRPASV